MLCIHLVGWPMRGRSSAVALADLLVQRQCGLPHKHPLGGVGILLLFSALQRPGLWLRLLKRACERVGRTL